MDTRLDQMKQAVIEYHRTHPEVWDLFVKYTFDRINQGFKNYSVNGVFERIRWHKGNVGGDGHSEFKIGNNHRPFYARRFMKMYPQHDGFFRTRIQKSAFDSPLGSGEVRPSDIEYE